MRLPRILTIPLAAALTLTAYTTPALAADTPPLWDTSQALQAIPTLPADNPAPADWNTQTADNTTTTHPKAFDKSTGRTGWFGDSWFDVDANRCDTRNDILTRDLTDVTLKDKSTCQVATGTLTDPYTGKVIAFKRGKDTSQAVQIDHVIPLGYVYAHGAWAWDADKRLSIANDPLNLLAVDGPTNASKSDSGPATSPSGTTTKGTYNPSGGPGWTPPSTSYTCTYAARFTQVAATYKLGLPQADKDWLTTTLTDCTTHTTGPDTDPAPDTTTPTAPQDTTTTTPQDTTTAPSPAAADVTPTATTQPTTSRPTLTATLASTGAGTAALALAIVSVALVTAGVVILIRRRTTS